MSLAAIEDIYGEARRDSAIYHLRVLGRVMGLEVAWAEEGRNRG